MSNYKSIFYSLDQVVHIIFKLKKISHKINNMSVDNLIQDLTELFSNPTFVENYLNKCTDIDALEKFDKIINYRTQLLRNKAKAKEYKRRFYDGTLALYDESSIFNSMQHYITPEFADFLNVNHERKLTRTEGQKIIYAYIWDKGLIDFDDTRIIILDDALKKLFKTHFPKSTYTDINKYLSKLFVK